MQNQTEEFYHIHRFHIIALSYLDVSVTRYF
jgi:hypothetical protein